MRSSAPGPVGVRDGEAAPREVRLSGVLMSILTAPPRLTVEGSAALEEGEVSIPPDPDDTDTGVLPRWGDAAKKGEGTRVANGPAKTSVIEDEAAALPAGCAHAWAAGHARGCAGCDA
eukprot:10760574-Alexandrium_andersonii.AAC.1